MPVLTISGPGVLSKKQSSTFDVRRSMFDVRCSARAREHDLRAIPDLRAWRRLASSGWVYWYGSLFRVGNRGTLDDRCGDSVYILESWFCCGVLPGVLPSGVVNAELSRSRRAKRWLPLSGRDRRRPRLAMRWPMSNVNVSDLPLGETASRRRVCTAQDCLLGARASEAAPKIQMAPCCSTSTSMHMRERG